MRYAIADIHGCIKTFEALLNMLKFSYTDELYLLGDYIDRGTNSKAVLDLIISMIESGYKVEAIRGNHEEMFLAAYHSETNLNMWQTRNGGNRTLESFGVDTVKQIPQNYYDFIHELPYFILKENYVLVHGGLNFQLDSPFKDKEAMLWSRNSEVEIDLKKTGERKLIVGHTPLPLERIRESLKSNLIMIDGGCVYHKSSNIYGKLTAFEIDYGELIHIENCE